MILYVPAGTNDQDILDSGGPRTYRDTSSVEYYGLGVRPESSQQTQLAPESSAGWTGGISRYQYYSVIH